MYRQIQTGMGYENTAEFFVQPRESRSPIFSDAEEQKGNGAI
jgi:hypothetical protein